jgi:uncharacterized spore protein YtfJ
MEQTQKTKKLLETITERLTKLAKESAVVSKPISVDGRFVVPLCRLGMGYGGGGGGGGHYTSGSDDSAVSTGDGMGAGGGAGVKPLAVLVIDGDDVRLESLFE